MPPEPGSAPTPRELEILAACVSCASMKEAARALGIAEPTVNKMLRRTRVRMGAANMAQLVYMTRAQGLLHVPGLEPD
jgi:DNA-binding NarL/FixJ family response regulator